jgi:protoporphyrinogen oxidase
VNRVAIVGAGLSGLALAHALLRRAPKDAPIEVLVFEREGRAGGLVGTDRVDGFLHERGPNGFLDRAPATRWACLTACSGATTMRAAASSTEMAASTGYRHRRLAC